MSTVGFTGTRYGMTLKQELAFREVIAQLKPESFMHGDCVGADIEAHDIVKELFPLCAVYIFPATSTVHRKGTHTYPPDLPLKRNRKIVSMSKIMIASPLVPDEQVRGGTWSTIRFARSLLRPLYLLLPNGDVLMENM